MYFPDLPMGTEAYYIYVGSDNTEIKANDLTTFNGKKIGVNKGSFQEERHNHRGNTADGHRRRIHGEDHQERDRRHCHGIHL